MLGTERAPSQDMRTQSRPGGRVDRSRPGGGPGWEHPRHWGGSPRALPSVHQLPRGSSHPSGGCWAPGLPLRRGAASPSLMSAAFRLCPVAVAGGDCGHEPHVGGHTSGPEGTDRQTCTEGQHSADWLPTLGLQPCRRGGPVAWGKGTWFHHLYFSSSRLG